jgi:hypothetical protein
MKKTLLGVVIVGAAFILSGCGKPAAVDQNAAQNPSPAQQSASTSGSVISSIKDAMGLGKEMKCEYSAGTDSNAVKSTAYVEGQKYKSTGIFAGITSNIIFDGDVMYIWQEGKTTGMKMTMACINDLKAAMPAGQQTTPGVQSPEDQFKNATNTSCSPSTDSVDFSAPSNVTFTDQCEMIKKLQQMKNNIPSGAVPTNIPNMPNIPAQ